MMKIRRRNIESDKLIEHGKKNGNRLSNKMKDSNLKYWYVNRFT